MYIMYFANTWMFRHGTTTQVILNPIDVTYTNTDIILDLMG